MQDRPLLDTLRGPLEPLARSRSMCRKQVIRPAGSRLCFLADVFHEVRHAIRDSFYHHDRRSDYPVCQPVSGATAPEASLDEAAQDYFAAARRSRIAGSQGDFHNVAI